ncbi:MAG: ABC-F family ATP-binding cassette domain-containing protein [Micrococcaceae bacterium]
MLSAEKIELRVGFRILMDDVNFTINKGQKVGLVGRNGAGKTTLMKVLANQTKPYLGKVTAKGAVDYLPQDPRTGNLEQTARERILSARELDTLTKELRQTELDMASTDEVLQAKAMKKYSRIEANFIAKDGYAAESEAATIAANLALPDDVLDKSLKALSGGQRRRVELARILFAKADILLLDEPTNHLDADSIDWLKNYLKNFSGGLIIISHDLRLIRATVNKVFYLDAQRGTIDIYNMGWDKYLTTRENDEKRRKKERAHAEKQANRLITQANKMRAKASKATAAQNMLKRAEKLTKGLAEVGQADRVANIRFPEPLPCGKTPLIAKGLAKAYGSEEIFIDVDVAVDKGSRIVVLGLNGAGKTTLLRILAGLLDYDLGEITMGHGAKLGYYAQEHETLQVDKTVFENMSTNATELSDEQCRNLLGSFMFSGDDIYKSAGVLSGGEKTRLALAILVASSANVLLLDEPTNNLDPASREEILSALRKYEGAIIMVSHDAGAVEALNPDRVIMMPDGDEDFWSTDYLDLIEIS